MVDELKIPNVYIVELVVYCYSKYIASRIVLSYKRNPELIKNR